VATNLVLAPTVGPSTPLRSETKAGCIACGGTEAVAFLAAPDRFHGRNQVFQLVRCPTCSLVWLQDPPRPEDMGQHYGPDYDRSVAAAGDYPERWIPRRDVLLQHKPSGALLDLGCSSGGFLDAIKGPAWKLYGIEMSESVARRAEKRTGAQIFVGDILDAPYAPESFDAITCFHVFEHLYQPREVLAKVAQWLKPGGVFYAMMPNIHSAGVRIFGSYWYGLELPRHLYFFSPKSLTTLGRSVGLEPLSVTTDREVFIETSTGYYVDEKLRAIGIHRTPLAVTPKPGIPYRVVRKAFRLTLLPVLNGMASLAGDGESIHALLRKGPAR
jgi:SAM-dependent methyltransferase